MKMMTIDVDKLLSTKFSAPGDASDKTNAYILGWNDAIDTIAEMADGSEAIPISFVEEYCKDSLPWEELGVMYMVKKWHDR